MEITAQVRNDQLRKAPEMQLLEQLEIAKSGSYLVGSMSARPDSGSYLLRK
jgi:hypothetical protein